MQVNPILTVFGLLMNVDISGVLFLIVIFSMPAFFFLRRVYRRKFKDNKGKVLVWSIATSVLLSTILVAALVATLVIWLITEERMRY